MTINFEPVKDYLNRTVPKIISVGTAFPEKSYTQSEVFEALKYPRQFRSIFMNSDIDTRYFWIPLYDNITWQKSCEEYEKGAVYLTERVVKSCLDNVPPDKIASFSFASCTGYQCPSIAHRVMKILRIPQETFFTPILGTGCEGGFPALKRAYDFTKATGKCSLAVSCELSSVCHFPEDGANPDTTRDYELLRANAIFGDGASAVLIGYDDNPRHPFILDFETYFNPDNMEHLGFLWQDGRLRCLLSRQVPKIVPGLAAHVLTKILIRNNLELEDIRWWVIHPGGKAVLDNVRDTLKMPEEKMVLSREILRKYGNCSSASIGIIGKRLMSENVVSGQYVMVVSFGAGLACGATLLQFP